MAFLGNYLPRKCGIATFTTDLCESIASEFPETQCFAVPVTDTSEEYAYPDVVRFEIQEQDLSSYQHAADFLNISNVGVVSLFPAIRRVIVPLLVQLRVQTETQDRPPKKPNQEFGHRRTARSTGAGGRGRPLLPCR